MEESELEEGEAYFYNNNNDYHGSIAPDTDLHIDERLQDVLGHFQKAFEGGVSAENLGAKFGGYGSFLPTYQRSPVWSHPKTPTKPQNCAAPRSPNILLVERGITASSSALKKARPGPMSSSVPSLSVSKALSSNDSAKQKTSMKSNHTETSASRKESADKRPVVFSKQNSLKLRIKVGSDNLPAEKNAAIYSGLGLDVSPSSSLDNSLSESEGMYNDPQDSAFESPTSILMDMTSHPLDGDRLLSPLSNELIRFIEKEKVLKENRCTPPSKFLNEISHVMMNGSETRKGGEKPLAQKKTKMADRNNITVEANGRIKKSVQNGSDAAVKREMETGASYPTDADTTRGITKLYEAPEENTSDAIMGKVASDVERGLSGPNHKDPGLDENPRTSSAGSVQEDKRASSLDGASDCSRKDSKYKGRKVSDSAKMDAKASKGKHGKKDELEDSSRKHKAGQRDTVDEQDAAKSLKEREPQWGGKKKLKENRCSSVPETRKNVQSDNHTAKKELVALKSQKGARKAEDAYKDFFGDMGESEEEDHVYSMEVKGSRKSEKVITSMDNMSEDLSFQMSELNPKAVPNAAPPTLNKPGSDAPVANSNPACDNWVACDKCGKWRLLPFGILPKDLPEKWLCSMLNWLPGMNNCNVPEEETTNALTNPAPAPESQVVTHSNLGDGLMKKRKKGLKEMTNGSDKESSRTMETNKKTMQASARNGSVNPALFVNKPDGSLGDLPEERHKHKQKEKVKLVDQNSHGGDSKSLKSKSKREANLESSLLAKKMKTESFLFTDKDHVSEHDGDLKHGRPSSSSGMPSVSTDNDRRRYSDHSKESQSDRKHRPQVSTKRPKGEVALDLGNSDGTEAKRKRKVRENYDSQVCKEELSENKNQKQKKARVSKYEEKESKGNANSEKKSTSFSKREYGHVQNSVGATSSSSKISDSHKVKTNFHEAKGSPVESVSSSPMRIPDPEKSLSVKRKKDEPHDANLLAVGGLKRFSDGEDDGGGSDKLQSKKDKYDFLDKDSTVKAKERNGPSPDIKSYDFENGNPNDLPQKKDHSYDQGRQTNEYQHSNGLRLRKSGKGSSSGSKDKNQSVMADSQDDPRHVEKKKCEGRFAGESSKTEGQTDLGGRACPDAKVNMARTNISNHYDVERTSERILSEKGDKAEIASEMETSQLQPSSRGVQDENSVRHSSLLSMPKKVDKGSTSAGHNSQADDVLKATAQIRRKNNLGNSLQNEHSPSPLRKELTSSQAAHNALREAKDLKHTADRLKNTVSNLEHIELYFQACLKFLHGAFLLELSSNESARQGETMVQSMKIYSSTANLCGFCAHEYEKSKDMGAAALAYKCMEVAYMRVVNSSYTSANRYRNELQASLQMIPLGESPSSSASDVDNMNHPATAEKIGTSKGVNSPLVTGNHIISSQNRSNVLRLLQFAQDVSLAMDASRKSRVALAATIGNLGEAEQGEGTLSIKRALDYNFQDIEGFLRLVRLAMEANNR